MLRIRSRFPGFALFLTLFLSALVPSYGQDIPLLGETSDGKQPELPSLKAEGIPHPTDFLGYRLGERFTHHHRIIDYFEALEAASDRISMEDYGETYEGRPLKLFVFASPDLLQRLDLLRRGQLRLAEPDALPTNALRDLMENQPAITWLAYGVHGNESSSSEAAMATAYVLAAGGEEVERWLRNTIVIIDPLVNPDGRERYVHSFETRRGLKPDASPEASEHFEPWPGGRFNHYLFDLNRDWTWASQIETRHRLKAYQRWEPHVYVDLHEMSPNSTYFFPPAAEPINAEISPSVIDWLEVFGRQNAAAFDVHGWLYYIREVFDLFYPGYGDTYPALRGAVGMTYEMAGGGRAGQDLQLPDGRRLKLADRIARHFTTSIATVRTASQNRSALVREFVEGRQQRGESRAYLWHSDQPEAQALASLLELHGLEVNTLPQERRLKASDLTGDLSAERTFPAGTFVVSTDQPLGRLLRALMEPEQEGISSRLIERQRQRVEAQQSLEFFDITAWSLPLAFDLEAFRFSGRLNDLTPATEPETGLRGRGKVGFLIPPQGLASYRVAAQLLARSAQMRVSLTSFENGDRTWPSGTLFIPRTGNLPDIDRLVEDLVNEAEIVAYLVASSYSDRGSLGSETMTPLLPVRAGILSGEGIRPTSFGFTWYLLDPIINMNASRLDLEALPRLDLSRFDVLILPDGRYDRALADESGEALKRWIEAGGQLISIGSAWETLKAKEWISVKSWESPADDEPVLPDDFASPLERLDIETPGAILATEYQPFHPLNIGLRSAPPTLFVGSTILLPTGNPNTDVLTVAADAPVLGGFVWPEAEERLRNALLVSSESVGSGRVVVFAQEPFYRAFWRGTTPLFLNAVLYGKSLP